LLKTGYTVAQKCLSAPCSKRRHVSVDSQARDQWGDKRCWAWFDNYEALKAATPPAGKTTSVEPPISVRGDRLSGTMVLPQEFRAKPADSYILQVASFRDRDRAELLAQQIRDKGFETSIELFAVGQGELSFRVRVGPYADLTAQEVAQEILAKSGHRALILPWQTARQAS
jgi:cell division septation protein DedD